MRSASIVKHCCTPFGSHVCTEAILRTSEGINFCDHAHHASHGHMRTWVDVHRDPPNVLTECAHVFGGRPHTPCDQRTQNTRSDTRFCAPIAPSAAAARNGPQPPGSLMQPRAVALACPLLACRAVIVAAPHVPPPAAAAHCAQVRPSGAPPSRNRRVLRPSRRSRRSPGL